MPRAEWKVAGTFPVSIPSNDAAAALTQEARAIYQMIVALTHESRALRLARDLMLPKLFSKEIELPIDYDPGVQADEASTPQVAQVIPL
jgi:hypothetical protein